MEPTMSFTLYTSGSGMDFGVRVGVKNGEDAKAHIELKQLLNRSEDIEISIAAGTNVSDHHQVVFESALTIRGGVHQLSLQYLFDRSRTLSFKSPLASAGATYTMGVGHNWGRHSVRAGWEGTSPFPFGINWEHG